MLTLLSEITEVKKTAVDTVVTTEELLHEMIHWTEKSETRDRIRILTRDEVWKLPERSYPGMNLSKRTDEILNYFYTRNAVA